MGRLSLRLPAELGGAHGADGEGSSVEAEERGRRRAPRRRAGGDAENPRMVRWLACLAERED